MDSKDKRRLEFYHKENALPEELRSILGDRWAICRDTASNRERHGRCVTPKQHEAACAKVLALRRQRMDMESVIDPDKLRTAACFIQGYMRKDKTFDGSLFWEKVCSRLL